MDKRNYTLTDQEKQAALSIIRKAKAYVIRAMENAQVFRRKRKLTSYDKLFAALYQHLAEGLSFRKLSSYMDCKHQVSLSPTAWKKQCYKAIPALREACLSYASQCVEKAPKQPAYALDATAFSAQRRPATVIRVHSAVSLDDGLCRYDKITDERIAESVRNFPIQAGSLYLGDRAYGKAKQLTYLLERGADFLIRFSPTHIKLYKDAKCSKRIDISALLQGSAFSRICYIRDEHHAYPARVVGMRLPQEAHEHAQKKYVLKPKRIRRGFVKARWNTQNGCC